MRMTLSEILTATGAVGDLGEGENPVIAEVCADSRSVAAGSLFACIPGERFDGHNFAAEALKKGAAAVMADRPMPDISGGAPVLLVRDVVAALGLLASAWRRKTNPVLAAVTGSAGKTTVKEMLAAILSRMAPTAKNYKNFNNLIGLPQSMLAAGAKDRFWVMELGISVPGEMEKLAAIAAPDLAIIHNVGPAHLEGFKDVAGVARAKCVLLKNLGKGAKALAGMDYPELWEEARSAFPRVMGMSTKNPDAMFYGRYLGPAESGRGRFSLRLRDTRMEFVLPFRGAHFAENVLAAASAAHALGASAKRIEEGLCAVELPEQRFTAKQAGEFTVIDDTYNANPLSMRRSIQAAAEEAAERGAPLVLILGEMREMGERAASEHRELGGFIAQTGCAAAFYVGGFGEELASGLSEAGFAGKFARIAKTGEFLQGMKNLGFDHAVLLFKGSRSNRMEDYAQAFMAEARKDGGA